MHIEVTVASHYLPKLVIGIRISYMSALIGIIARLGDF